MNYNVYVYGFSRICFMSDPFEDQCENYVHAHLLEQVHSGAVYSEKMSNRTCICYLLDDYMGANFLPALHDE